MGRLRAASYHRAFQASKKPGCTLSAAGFIKLFNYSATFSAYTLTSLRPRCLVSKRTIPSALA